MEPVLDVAASAYARPDADELRREVEPHIEPVVVDEVQVPIPEIVVPAIELAEPVAEVDHAALLDQRIPIDDPDVEEMPLELVAEL